LEQEQLFSAQLLFNFCSTDFSRIWGRVKKKEKKEKRKRRQRKVLRQNDGNFKGKHTRSPPTLTPPTPLLSLSPPQTHPSSEVVALGEIAKIPPHTK
jgi:hypothetical protein